MTREEWGIGGQDPESPKPPERLGAKQRVPGCASQSITRKVGLGGALRPQTDFIKRKIPCCLAATKEISPQKCFFLLGVKDGF